MPRAYLNTETRSAIVVNGQGVVNIFSHGDSGRHDQGTNVAVVNLRVGDKVWIRAVGIVQTAYGDSYSAFSGFLLQA